MTLKCHLIPEIEESSDSNKKNGEYEEGREQAEMILLDKKETLTCNQMEFRKCSIEGISYGGEVTQVDLAASRRMNI